MSVKSYAKKERLDMGKMEVWVQKSERNNHLRRSYDSHFFFWNLRKKHLDSISYPVASPYIPASEVLLHACITSRWGKEYLLWVVWPVTIYNISVSVWLVARLGRTVSNVQ